MQSSIHAALAKLANTAFRQSVDKRRALGLPIAIAAIALIIAAPAARANNAQRWNTPRNAAILVTSAQHPALARAIQQELNADRRASRLRGGAISVHLDRIRLDVDFRRKQRTHVSVPIAQGSQRSNRFKSNHRQRARCQTPIALDYVEVSGRTRAAYKLRYSIQALSSRQIHGRAKGKVLARSIRAEQAQLVTRCGREQASPRTVKQITGIAPGSARRPLADVRIHLARDIAADIRRDLRQLAPRNRL